MIESSSPRRQTRLLPALLGSLLLAACGPSAELAPPAPPALVITAQEGAEASQQVYSGEVRARHEADLAFRIPGKLISRKVEAGSPVKAGDVLAQLDPSDMTLNSDTAQAQALAAEIDYNYSKAELERYDNLLEKKYISPAIHDAKRAMFATSKARLEQARSQARVAGNQAGYATLRADRDGLITLVMAEPGQVVGAGQPVIRLAQIKVGDPASVRLWAGEGKPYEGRVREIAPAADMLTRTFSAKIAILDASPEIRLGMTANVTLGLSGEAAVSLPLTAVTQKEGQPQVWIIENGQDGVSRAQPRPVKIGKFSNETASVIEGLKPGEQVIAVGVHKLLPGMAVRPQAMNGATRP